MLVCVGMNVYQYVVCGVLCGERGHTNVKAPAYYRQNLRYRCEVHTPLFCTHHYFAHPIILHTPLFCAPHYFAHTIILHTPLFCAHHYFAHTIILHTPLFCTCSKLMCRHGISCTYGHPSHITRFSTTIAAPHCNATHSLYVERM
jgi:hypothetical protein